MEDERFAFWARPILLVVLLALIGGFAVLFGGCGASAGQVLRGGAAALADVAECAPAEYGAVETALRSGGSSWIGVVLEAIHCIPKVVHDIQAATATADASGEVAPPGLSRGARRRMAVAVAMHAVCSERWKR